MYKLVEKVEINNNTSGIYIYIILLNLVTNLETPKFIKAPKPEVTQNCLRKGEEKKHCEIMVQKKKLMTHHLPKASPCN